MVFPHRPFPRTLLIVAVTLCIIGGTKAQGQAQPMVQVPFNSIAVGVPDKTYNGTNQTSCPPSTPGYLDSEGDGCLPTQAVLNYPYGVSIDKLNNIYVAENNTNFIRVVYQGGTALAAALIAANPSYTFTPTVGHIYGFGGQANQLSSPYYCSGKSGPVASDAAGDGCPAQSAYMKPRNVAVDRDGNIFIAASVPTQSVKIIYVAGTAAYNLIKTYNPTVTPQIGYIYALSAATGATTAVDFGAIRDIAIDSNENVYAIDSNVAANSTNTKLQATTYGNQIKKFTGTGWATYIPGSTAANPTLADGDGGIATSATIYPSGASSSQLFFDANNNLYILDGGDNRLRVVYNSGTTPPLYVQGNNATVVTTPVAGYIYTVAGGGATTSTGALASALSLGTPVSSGSDASGNLYFTDSSKNLWREDARTGFAVIIGGYGASSATGYSTTANPGAGVPCNGATGGPLMTDADGGGCPATEVIPYGLLGRIAFDTSGQLYQSEYRVSAQPDGIVRRYSFTNGFSAVTDGTSTQRSVAYTPSSTTTYTPTPGYVLTGSSTTEFADAGNDLCSLTGPSLVQTCVYNATFTPALAGPRFGALLLSSGGTTLATTDLSGIGNGAEVSLDPATQVILGTGLTPSGVGIGQAGNVFIADITTGNVLRSVAGATPAIFATGFNKPAQLAVDGVGSVYVADSGNNRLAMVTSAGLTSSLLTTFGGTALKTPDGVAVDASGNIYIADTGNQRVLSISATGVVAQKALTGLSTPTGVAVDAAGDLFVADTGNSRIVELTAAGVQSTVGITTLSQPVGIAVDAAGDLFISDASNLNVVMVPSGNTTPSTLLGNTSGLSSLAVDSTGDVFLAATSRIGVVELNRSHTAYTYPDTNLGQTANLVITETSIGNLSLELGPSLAAGTDTTNFSIASSTTNGCSPSQILVPGQNCGLTAVFQPASRGAQSDSVTFPSSAVSSVTAQLSGQGVQKINTATSVIYTTTTGGLPLAGQPFTVTATITASQNVGTVTGTVMFSVDGGTPQSAMVNNGVAATMLTLAAGPHTILASYGGDANYVASSGNLSLQTVSPAATTTALSVTSAGTPQSGSPFTVTATVSSSASQGAITGTVTFTANSTTQVVNLVNGSASATYTFTTGKYPVTATYSGNDYYLTSSGNQTVQVVPAGTSSVKLTVTSPAGGITYGQTVVVNAATTNANATGTPTGTVTFTVDGGSAQTFPFAASVSASFPLLAAGNHTLTATYNGDNTFAPGTGSLNITIAKASVMGTLVATPNVSSPQNTITLTASVASTSTVPTGTVTFMAGSTLLATVPVTAGVAAFTTKTNALGSYAFTASYSGDSSFLGATLGDTEAPKIVATIVTPSVTTPQGGVALDYLNINAFFGYTGAIQVACTGLPANSVCRATPAPIPVTADSAQTAQLQIYTNVNPQIALVTPGRGRFQLGGTIGLAVCLLFGLRLHRRRCYLRSTSLAILCLTAAAICLSGCGSDTANSPTYSTPTGTFQVTVTATDGTVSSSRVFSLTVIQ